jgi:hypothetical protein
MVLLEVFALLVHSSLQKETVNTYKGSGGRFHRETVFQIFRTTLLPAILKQFAFGFSVCHTGGQSFLESVPLPLRDTAAPGAYDLAEKTRR